MILKNKSGILTFLPWLVSFVVLFSSGVTVIAKDHPQTYNIHPTIHRPVIDGVQQTIPAELGNTYLSTLGFVDITAPPFSADPSGKKDSTRAIQQAINFARDHQMICFFPGGTYLISDTLSCIQNLYRRKNGKIAPGRHFPCVLVGSRVGKRPTILLAPDSAGFRKASKPKYMIHFWARSKKNPGKSQPNISFNQMLVNIDLSIGSGNYGAVGIRHRGAQGSAVQESIINAGEGLAGISGGCGSGGSFADITIIGGRIGLDMRDTQPAPTISGVTLRDQHQTALYYSGRQTLTAVGLVITSSSKEPVIKGEPVGWAPFHGQISLVDSRIEINNPQGIAISSSSNLFMEDVYVKGVDKVVEQNGKILVQGPVRSWLHIKEYAHGVRPRKYKGYQFETPVYIDGKQNAKNIIFIGDTNDPPGDLQQRHLWSDLPDWQSGKAVNVKAPPYNAIGDGRHDDTGAIQQAINENEIIFVPKGYYLLSDTLQLKSETKIIGSGRHLSLFTTKESFNAAATQPKPLIQTVNQQQASTVIAFCGFYIPRGINKAYALQWQCGGDSILRAVNFWTRPGLRNLAAGKKMNHPLVMISGNGGGKWYNFFQEDKSIHQGPEYRHLKVANGKGPLAFYQCNLEHAESAANMEISNYANVAIYGLKGERPAPVLVINDSDHISIYGYGGNASARQDGALFKIAKTPNFLIANAVDTPAVKKNSSPIDTWHMIVEETEDGQYVQTVPLERPVLYKRGLPDPDKRGDRPEISR